MILKKIEFNKRLNEYQKKIKWTSTNKRALKKEVKKDWNIFVENSEERIKNKFILRRNFIEVRRWIVRWRKHYWNSFNCSCIIQYLTSSKRCENLRSFHEESKNSTQEAR
jgi:hypothetical protein